MQKPKQFFPLYSLPGPTWRSRAMHTLAKLWGVKLVSYDDFDGWRTKTITYKFRGVFYVSQQEKYRINP